MKTHLIALIENSIQLPKIDPLKSKSKSKAYQFEARRESDFAGVKRRSNHLLRDLPPLLRHAGATHHVAAVGPLVLAVLHAAYDFPQQLREHRRPRRPRGRVRRRRRKHHLRRRRWRWLVRIGLGGRLPSLGLSEGNREPPRKEGT